MEDRAGHGRRTPLPQAKIEYPAGYRRNTRRPQASMLPYPTVSSSGVSGVKKLRLNEYSTSVVQPPIIPPTNPKPESTCIEPEGTTAKKKPKCRKCAWILMGLLAALLIILVVFIILLWQFGIVEGKNEKLRNVDCAFIIFGTFRIKIRGRLF